MDLSKFRFIYDYIFGCHIICSLTGMSCIRCILIFDIFSPNTNCIGSIALVQAFLVVVWLIILKIAINFKSSFELTDIYRKYCFAVILFVIG